jgi:hypothetical protein
MCCDKTIYTTIFILIMSLMHYSKIKIDDILIAKLLSKRADHTINNKKYQYIGKGGDGVIYRLNDRAIKIYLKYDINSIVKDFYVVGILQELKKINMNVIQIDNYYLSLSNPVMIMKYMTGDLSKWSTEMIQNKESLSDDELEKNWLSMIFQVSYGFRFLNKIGILHNDGKPKNIMYEKTDIVNYSKDKYKNYTINGKEYKIPINYIFKIADFGAVQLKGSSLNKLSDFEISSAIEKREDLRELSRIIFRLLVDFANRTYNLKDILRYVEKDNAYKIYYKEQKRDISEKLKTYSRKVKDRFLFRSLLYYGLENNVLDQSVIINKFSLIMPSKKVLKLLDSLIDPEISDLFEGFDMFIIK